MKKSLKLIILLIFIALLVFIAFISFEIITTYRAHKTFEGYCKWRGLEVINKSIDYGYCKDKNTEKEFKIVYYNRGFNSGWYLDGDLPGFPW